MKTTKCYKILDRNNCSYNSIFLLNSPADDYIIKYKPLRWTKPLIFNSKLFVFDTLENLHKFLGHIDVDYYMSIWEAQATGVKKGRVAASRYEDFSEFWMNNSKIKVAHAPKGTLFADQVRIIKRIPFTLS